MMSSDNAEYREWWVSRTLGMLEKALRAADTEMQEVHVDSNAIHKQDGVTIYLTINTGMNGMAVSIQPPCQCANNGNQQTTGRISK